jgi:hypothetical protein
MRRPTSATHRERHIPRILKTYFGFAAGCEEWLCLSVNAFFLLGYALALNQQHSECNVQSAAEPKTMRERWRKGTAIPHNMRRSRIFY